MAPLAERERKQSSRDAGDSGCSLRPGRSIRSSCDIPGTRGEEDANSNNWKSAAIVKEDENIQHSDANAAILIRRNVDDERDYATRGVDRGRQDSDTEPVRIVAESFVDSVMSDLSSPASLMSLSLK